MNFRIQNRIINWRVYIIIKIIFFPVHSSFNAMEADHRLPTVECVEANSLNPFNFSDA